MREVKNLSDTKERVVYICEPEVGENLNDEERRSSRDLVDCQEGSNEISSCQIGNEKRSVDLIDFQEGISEIPYFQVGKRGEETI